MCVRARCLLWGDHLIGEQVGLLLQLLSRDRCLKITAISKLLLNGYEFCVRFIVLTNARPNASATNNMSTATTAKLEKIRDTQATPTPNARRQFIMTDVSFPVYTSVNCRENPVRLSRQDPDRSAKFFLGGGAYRRLNYRVLQSTFVVQPLGFLR